MHYYKRYSNLPFLEAEKKALEDCKDYLGDDEYIRITNAIADADDSPKSIRLTLAMLVGIEGYPVGALLREFRPETNETGDYGELR